MGAIKYVVAGLRPRRNERLEVVGDHYPDSEEVTTLMEPGMVKLIYENNGWIDVVVTPA